MNFAIFLKNQRLVSNKTMLELSADTEIDQALLSKYESGNRMPSDKHLLALAAALNVSLHIRRKEFLADKIAKMLYNEDYPFEILMVAESRVEYLTSKRALQLQELTHEIQQKLFDLEDFQKKWQESKPMNTLQLEKLKEYLI